MLDCQTQTSSIFPVTVICAIFLFFIKEAVELSKRAAERKRKISAYKTLIAEELKKNAWTIQTMKEKCSEINKDDFERMTYSKEPSGNETVQIWFSGGTVGSSLLWQVHTGIFDKSIVDLAVIDKGLFDAAKETYQHLAEVRHIRGYFSDLTEQDSMRGFIKGFADYGLSTLDEASNSLSALYFKCTGEVLDEHKLRSYLP
ncbi:hypothetical protein V2K16_22900 [Pseudomonas alliivorans]|uniref:hypothetical protein n=1 Tax=Pseudomonas alliivorans TaxID=2810613 RepID=UPI001AE4C347|nr:hypothetical protein [Pseudomonas alliivorans]MBP0943129.1 hypothetical protein [Pseudomonas alliivorans]MEE4881224.1 hypothetical protein [Pseudomonas alliivorans]MEE4932528.1 hypothetical protein [Pseudomonas alliivorans]MEE4937991.1 hypothetical protein [Pseudomonas alliivorans]MEE4943077.1 hypothetical protein [Pseudomonas alliivorans]